MLQFSGTIAPKEFYLAALLRVGLFIASIFLFPLLLMGLPKVVQCGGGVCGALGVVISMAVKPLVFVAFVFSMIGICLRRMRDAGLPAAFGLLVPILLSADSNFGIYAATPWGFGFSSGVLTIVKPIYFAFALICIGLMGLLPSRGGTPSSADPRRVDVMALLIITAAIGIVAIARILMSFNMTGMAFVLSVFMLLRAAPYLMAAFIMAALIFIWRERQAAPPRRIKFDRPTSAADTVAFTELIPPTFVLIAGAAMTLAALQIAGGRAGDPLAMIVGMTTFVLPTYVLYTLPLWAFWYFTRRPGMLSVGLMVLTLLPFGWWAKAHLDAANHRTAEANEIAAVATAPLGSKPDTLFYDTDESANLKRLIDVTGVRQIIIKDGGRLRSYTGQQESWGGRKLTDVEALPEDYLHLRIGRSSSFAKPRQIYRGGPYELRNIAPGHDDLIGVWYRAFYPDPVALPILTTQGWLFKPNVTTMDSYTAEVSQFLKRSLRISS